ncbi:hypothetical protein GGH92_005051 [Coemansia sp. RSA 2673]|nr:hypothetical protein GGH92_005051 [Coemansia sp. RSA 2673]
MTNSSLKPYTPTPSSRHGGINSALQGLAGSRRGGGVNQSRQNPDVCIFTHCNFVCQVAYMTRVAKAVLLN